MGFAGWFYHLSCIDLVWYNQAVEKKEKMLVVLGPTASGKTRLGVRLAARVGGEIVSADSRQVYRGLDIGSGKDLDEYIVNGGKILYHLIDVVDLDVEFSVFDFQRMCLDILSRLWRAGVVPVMVGGSGLYLESVILGYSLKPVPVNPKLRSDLEAMTNERLAAKLRMLRGNLHNTTDIEDRNRLIRAVEIAVQSGRNARSSHPMPDTLVLGVRWTRDDLRQRIRLRLLQRIKSGLIEEVERLVSQGVPWSRLRSLGLEYRYVADRLQGKISNQNDLIQKLTSAICAFAKRQDTWFRRMERKGVAIHWIEKGDYEKAIEIVKQKHRIM